MSISIKKKKRNVIIKLQKPQNIKTTRRLFLLYYDYFIALFIKNVSFKSERYIVRHIKFVNQNPINYLNRAEFCLLPMLQCKELGGFNIPN